MDVKDLNTVELRALCGWQEIYTDFDSWVCTLGRHIHRKRSHPVIQSVKINIEDYETARINEETEKKGTNEETEKKVEFLTLHHLLVKGLDVKSDSQDIIKDLRNFLNVFQYGDSCVNYDYVLIKLLNGSKKYFYQYTRSKL
ncbi:uncharacterized protein LOC128199643 [Bicyclus anynana]|uniref:Uncharacterized protein LOC128199643 n=1 Tax=Bicyclus anynana TaxID=110368 RepID=A0ABM3M4G1_BICAN|nr:uncharacterized protein LOC128199643 [Bicyclus anynana]